MLLLLLLLLLLLPERGREVLVLVPCQVEALLLDVGQLSLRAQVRLCRGEVLTEHVLLEQTPLLESVLLLLLLLLLRLLLKKHAPARCGGSNGGRGRRWGHGSDGGGI